MNTKQIDGLLQKQLERGIYIYNDFGIIQKYSEQFPVEELDVTNKLIIDVLHSNGYITPNRKDFIEKSKLLFDIDIESFSNNNFYSYPISELKSQELIFFNKEEDFYISKSGFISGFYFIPELIDYKKTFPNKEEINHTDSSEKIFLWSDLSDLKRRRKKNVQRLLARNSYLFDNNKSYITWLICEDWKFIEKLIKIYGYDKEARFNQCFVDLYKTGNVLNDHELGYYLFYKDKNNLQIRQGLLQTIKNNFEENIALIQSLMIFCNYLLFDDILTIEYVKEDVLKIFAYLSNELDGFHNLD